MYRIVFGTSWGGANGGYRLHKKEGCVHPMNILLVDDDFQVRQLLYDFLSGHGHKVFDFDNGQSALDYINISKENMHLILSDICMPILNGIELIKAVRNQQNNIPVILVTGYANTEQLNDAEKLNANILGKPINFQLLDQLINKI